MRFDRGARPRAAASLLSTYRVASASAAASASSRARTALLAPPPPPPAAPKVLPRAASVAESLLAAARASASEAAPEAARKALTRSRDEPRRSVAASIPCLFFWFWRRWRLKEDVEKDGRGTRRSLADRSLLFLFLSPHAQ